jgi:hypothetical protein
MHPDFVATITFDEQRKKTLLSWHMLFETRELLLQLVKTFKDDKGLKQNADKLEAYLTKFNAK